MYEPFNNDSTTLRAKLYAYNYTPHYKEGISKGYSSWNTNPFSDPGDTYPSPREKLAWTKNTPRGSNQRNPNDPFASRVSPNPYRPLPPIARKDGDASPSDGYTALFLQKKNHKVDFKPYTVQDYRRLQKDVKLGKLGPDMDNDEFRDRNEKRSKQLEFARDAMEKNKAAMKTKRPPKYPQPKERNDIMNQHKLRTEYAKSLRAPKPREHPPAPKRRQAPGSKPPASDGSQPALETLEMEMAELERLAERHEREKETVASIRQSSRPVSQQAGV